MPIDASIPLQARPVEVPNMLAQYAQVAGIQNAQNQNAMAQYSLAKARREDEVQNALLREAATIGDDPEAQNKLLRRYGKFTEAAKLEEQRLQAQKLKQEIAVKRGQAIAGVVAAVHADPSDANVAMALDAAGAATGEPLDKVKQMILGIKDPAARKQQILALAMSHPDGRQALQALQAKVNKVDGGGEIELLNENPLAGPIGMKLAPSITKTATPESVLTDARAKEGQRITDARAREGQAETRRHNIAEEKLQSDRAGNLTESQGNATNFGMRASAAQSILADLEDKGTFGRVAGKVDAVKEGFERVPVIGTMAGNIAGGVLNQGISQPQQKYAQAKRDFITAVLRKESGATITPGEMSSADVQYFPQAGDGPDVIAQKKKNREQAIQGLRVQAGAGASKIPGGSGEWSIKRIE